MKGLKGLREPCLRALTIMLVVIVALTLVAQPVLAAQQPDNPLPGSKIEQEYTGAIDKLEPYLSISETGNIVLNAPKRIVDSIDSEVYQSLLAALKQTNSMIDSGYLVCNPDLTLSVTEKYLGACSQYLEPGTELVSEGNAVYLVKEGFQTLSSSGGIDAFYRYWWGCWIYLSDATCDEIVFQMGMGATETGLMAIIFSALGVTAPAAVVCAVVSLLLGLGATVIGQINVNNTGIKIRLHGYVIPTYIGPQSIDPCGVKGLVGDAATGYPLPYSTVTVKESGQVVGEVETDYYGQYAIILPPGTYEITASHIGFYDKTYTVVVSEGAYTTRNFQLTQQSPGPIPMRQLP